MKIFLLCTILMGVICYLGCSIEIIRAELEDIKKMLESKE